MDLIGAIWRKSSRSNGFGGDCVEIAELADGDRAIRDSKDPAGWCSPAPPPSGPPLSPTSATASSPDPRNQRTRLPMGRCGAVMLAETDNGNIYKLHNWLIALASIARAATERLQGLGSGCGYFRARQLLTEILTLARLRAVLVLSWPGHIGPEHPGSPLIPDATWSPRSGPNPPVAKEAKKDQHLKLEIKLSHYSPIRVREPGFGTVALMTLFLNSCVPPFGGCAAAASFL